MTDETAKQAENLAMMMAASIRLSQLLNITMEDAVSLMVKFGDAMSSTEAKRKKAS